MRKQLAVTAIQSLITLLTMQAKGSSSPPPRPESPSMAPKTTIPKTTSTACLACSSGHLAAISGPLKEAVRFARNDGLSHPEVARRLAHAEEELASWERFDASPEQVRTLKPAEKQLVRETAGKLRNLRHKLWELKNAEDLEQAAALAGGLTAEFRLKELQLRGVDTERIKGLAQKVKAGEMTLEEAKERAVEEAK